MPKTAVINVIKEPDKITPTAEMKEITGTEKAAGTEDTFRKILKRKRQMEVYDY